MKAQAFHVIYEGYTQTQPPKRVEGCKEIQSFLENKKSGVGGGHLTDPPSPSQMNQRDREEEREERPHTLAPSPRTNIIHILHQKDPMTRLHYNKILVEKKEETGYRLALALEVGGK